MNIDEILLKKWELLWNHYKLQNECVEKRRNFLWIIQTLIFTAWYKLFFDKSLVVALILLVVGLCICWLWLFVLKRERRSILITEQSLRDVEVEWGSLGNNIELNRFILDYELMHENRAGTLRFKHKGSIRELTYFEKKSASNILNNTIPIIIIVAWVCFISLTILKIYGVLN
jgi:hypothetical protein